MKMLTLVLGMALTGGAYAHGHHPHHPAPHHPAPHHPAPHHPAPHHPAPHHPAPHHPAPHHPRPVVIVHPGPVIVYRPHPGPIYVRPVHPRPELPWRWPVDRFEATTFLGYTFLSDVKDNDKIFLPACETRANNYVRQLRLVAGQRSVEIDWVSVTFENGETDLIELNRENFAPGQSSGWKDLRGGYRCIREIEIVGDANTNGAQAQVLFYGR